MLLFSERASSEVKRSCSVRFVRNGFTEYFLHPYYKNSLFNGSSVTISMAKRVENTCSDVSLYIFDFYQKNFHPLSKLSDGICFSLTLLRWMKRHEML